MQLSKNFKLSEFTKSGDYIVTPTDEQIFCTKVLCNNILQKIRDEFGPVVITSGIRDGHVYSSLIQRGYKPSRTSDHFG